ncbi:MAG: hypothetical protein QOE70_1439 [Chthoniobacter sp.]|jgi:hypothetical protein|nr:hypothetical protein [Chthoniobacter sp.]
MNFKRSALAAGAALVALALWLAWLWQPERQVRLHTAHLLGSVERRNWTRVESLLAEHYSDRWGHDKAFVLAGLRQVLGSFVFLRIEQESTALAIQSGSGVATTRVKIIGQGGPVGEYVMAKVNGLPEPFVFTWQKRSGKPWDWVLLAVDHPSLDLDSEPAL